LAPQLRTGCSSLFLSCSEKSWLVSDRADSSYSPLVIEIYFAANKNAIIQEYAMALAEAFNAQLTLLHVYEKPKMDDYAQLPDDYSIADLIRQNAQANLDSFWSEFQW
jgi:hypothetical protein